MPSLENGKTNTQANTQTEQMLHQRKHMKRCSTFLVIGKFKLKPQCDTTTQLLECLKSKRLII